MRRYIVCLQVLLHAALSRIYLENVGGCMLVLQLKNYCAVVRLKHTPSSSEPHGRMKKNATYVELLAVLNPHMLP